MTIISTSGTNNYGMPLRKLMQTSMGCLQI